MVARIALFGAILAALIQSAPLRACAVERQLAGTNCHTHIAEGGSAGEHQPGGEHGPCERGPSCRCQVSLLDADNAKPATMPELVPPLLVWIGTFGDSEASCVGMTCAAPARPPDPSQSVRLPLLN